jgi:uncharacterized protein (TIGR03067 family)
MHEVSPMRLLSLLTCVALPLAFAPAPLPKPDRGRDSREADLRRMQGNWKQIRYLIGHGERPVADCSVLIAGSSASFLNRGRVASVYELKLTPGMGPKTMTWTSKSNDVEQSRFSLEGDTLRICWTKDREPPGDLEPGPGREFMELRRVR